jgi:hypothetical protein
MPWRVRRSIRIARGIRLNLGKQGNSITLGRGPAHITISEKGTRRTISAPGTGLSYSEFTPAGQKPPGAGLGRIVVAALLVFAILWIIGKAMGER